MKTYRVEVDEHATKWYNEVGKLHREDGAAIEYANGDKYWYINGKLHREDGAAVEYANGDKYWYINGEELTEQQFNNCSNIPEYTMEELVAKLGNFKIKK